MRCTELFKMNLNSRQRCFSSFFFMLKLYTGRSFNQAHIVKGLVVSHTGKSLSLSLSHSLSLSLSLYLSFSLYVMQKIWGAAVCVSKQFIRSIELNLGLALGTEKPGIETRCACVRLCVLIPSWLANGWLSLPVTGDSFRFPPTVMIGL